MSDRPDIDIRDVTNAATFESLPPCANPGFDHRSCDYWENGERGAKTARPGWWERSPAAPARVERRPASDNPFERSSPDDREFNPFAAEASTAPAGFNPFAPEARVDPDAIGHDASRKLRLLDRGRGVFGSYANVLLLDGDPAVYAQFGPLSAYPRAQQIRELYPRLPAAPLPAVITCIATTPAYRGQGLARTLVEAVVVDLAGRGFAAVESYPDLALGVDEASAAHPAFWLSCGFDLAVDDERYPVMRRTLG